MTVVPGSGDIRVRPIGVIRTPHTEAGKTPIQPVYAEGIDGEVEVFPEFSEGLESIDGFSHLCLLFHFHRVTNERLTVTPYLEDMPHGVFATRAPSRPNRIGLSVVRLVRRSGNTLHVRDVDMLDGTPLLDIKPYIRRFVPGDEIRSGWLDDIDEQEAVRRGSRREPTDR
jgi:tRNA-Thr(GGU) m(6)t(6)A37 methyltransferase TsaA